METDIVLLLKCFTKVVAGLQTQHSCILSIYAQMGSAACVRALALELDGLSHAAVGAVAAAEIKVVAHIAAVDHHSDVAAVENAAVHELYLTAVILDDALLAETFSELELDHFLSGNSDQTDRTGEAVECAGLCQSSGDTQKCRYLAVVAAAVCHAVDRFGMVSDIKSVQLAEDGQLGAGLACFNVYPEAGDVAGEVQLIAEGLELLYEVVMSFPLGVTCLGMSPEPSLCIEDELLVSVNVLDDKFLSVCHVGYSSLVFN